MLRCPGARASVFSAQTGSVKINDPVWVRAMGTSGCAYVTLSAECHDKEAVPFGWLAVFPKPSDQGQRYLGGLTSEGFVQWDTTATLLNSKSSYFNARVRWTSPRIGERNNSLCPLSYFSRSSPW
jgi:hypothetical protein